MKKSKNFVKVYPKCGDISIGLPDLKLTQNNKWLELI